MQHCAYRGEHNPSFQPTSLRSAAEAKRYGEFAEMKFNTILKFAAISILVLSALLCGSFVTGRILGFEANIDWAKM